MKLLSRLLLVAIFGFILGFGWARVFGQSNQFTGIFKIDVEEGYGGASDGVRFISISRSEQSALDMANISIDADLPLAKFLLPLDKKRVLITIEEIPEKQLERIVR